MTAPGAIFDLAVKGETRLWAGLPALGILCRETGRAGVTIDPSPLHRLRAAGRFYCSISGVFWFLKGFLGFCFSEFGFGVVYVLEFVWSLVSGLEISWTCFGNVLEFFWSCLESL